MENKVSMIIASDKDEFESAKAYCTRYLEQIDKDTCVEIRDVRRDLARVYVSNFAHAKGIALKTKSKSSGLIVWKPREDGEDYPSIYDVENDEADFSAEIRSLDGQKLQILPYDGEKIRAFARRVLREAVLWDRVTFLGCDPLSTRNAAYYVSNAMDKPIGTKVVHGNLEVEMVKTTASRRFR